ncbi:MAG: hypothetical protein KC502_12000 [Myxococcales bacterium]|nr:hypothetical protein [Myxococcales bacterium]
MKQPHLHQQRSRVAGLALIALLFGVLALFSACEPAPTDGVFPDRQTDAAGSGDALAAADGVTPTDDPFVGTWAMATDWSVCVTVGSRIETRSRKLLVVNMTRKGHRLFEERTVCQLGLTPIFGLKTVVPKAVLDSVGPLQVESRVVGEGSVEVAYSSAPEAQLMGVKMVNPVYDPMPAKGDAADPRLTDPENDGKPGATFEVGGGCKLYVAQREVSSLMGRVVSPGRIEGGGVHATEQVVFGSSTAICGQPFATFSNTPHHRFVLQRLAKGQWDDNNNGQLDCAELVAHQGEFVTWRDPDNSRCPVEKP